MLAAIVEAFRAELGQGTAQVLLGASALAEHDSPPRIVWVPLSDSYGAPSHVGGNPRALYTRTASATLHIWGEDFAATELLLHRSIVALRRLASGPSVEIQSSQWTDDKGNQIKLGEVVLLNVGIQIPVHDYAHTTARIEAVAARTRFKRGTQ